MSLHTPLIPPAPAVNPDRLTKPWPAAWCQHPDGTGRHGDVLLFRYTLTLDAVPETFVVHVSADQRYRLWVNGASVAWGPARGDLLHWRFETVDLAPYLKAGDNVLAARVHFLPGDLAPQAQVTSGYAGFLLCGDTDAAAAANTPGAWKVWRDDAYSFSMDESKALHTYCVVGASERFDAARHPWGWESAGFDDSAWSAAVNLKKAAPFGIRDAESFWWLVRREIPAMEETPVPFGAVRRAEGVVVPDGWPASGAALTVPPNTRATLLLDHGAETCACPALRVSGGAGATVRLAYAEALQRAESEPWKNDKGDRNEIDGKVLRGYADTWRPDGSGNRILDTLWWRTFRYAELTVETGVEPLTVDTLSAVYTGYPFAERARFDAPEMTEMARIAEVGWRTARLCAHETYMDCPYYEQLQYAGDTRIQCLVSLYTSGDARLFKNALQQLDDSRMPFGLTASRHPSRIPQVISPFSLWWVCMAHDYWRHVPGDDAFLRGLLSGIRSVLAWFAERVGGDGLLGPLQWWNFVDWVRAWQNMGVPPGAEDGGSSLVTLQFILALDAATDLFTAFGHHDEARKCARLRRQLTQAVRKLCWDDKTARIADTPARKTYSQHGIALAVLAPDLLTGPQKTAAVERMLTDESLAQATYYFRFYVNRALVAAGRGGDYLGAPLDPWRRMLDLGLTTWAEEPDPTRSDCHAWSSSPNYEFLATVLGVTPAAPGWASVAVRPHPGPLTRVSGSVPHPNGQVDVSHSVGGDGTLTAEVILPPGVTGHLSWAGHTPRLQPGRNQITVPGRKSP
jgi:hypothetical protein